MRARPVGCLPLLPVAGPLCKAVAGPLCSGSWPRFSRSAKQLVRGEPNVSYICSRYYRAPELIFGATDYTSNIGKSTPILPLPAGLGIQAS